MIKGIGNDIVEVARLEKSLKRDAFKEKVFSKSEIAYCDQSGAGVQSYAGKFAAKEAFFKALGTGWRGEVQLNDVEVLNDDLGKPFIHLTSAAMDALGDSGLLTFHVAISHAAGLAIAHVVAEKNDFDGTAG